MRVLASFARVYVERLEEAIALFQPAPGEPPRLRFSHASGLELALVGDVLILAGPEEVLAPFRATQVTQIVDDLDGALAFARGVPGPPARLVRPPAEQPTGRNATVAFPGGAVVEYVEWSAATRAQAGV